METNKDHNGMLDLLIRPGFYVENHRIVYANQAAQALLLCPGTDVRELLLTGSDEYETFREGCLYLQLNIAGGCGASVLAMENRHLFLLDQESDDDALRAMALAARELREPLTGMQLSVEQLSARNDKDQEQLARLSRSVHQMLRILANMSDAGRSTGLGSMELRNIPEVISGIFAKAHHLVSLSGMTLQFRNLEESVLGLMDEASLERAILNILSNAIKFSPQNSVIHAQLTRHGRMLKLTIRDSGSGIARNLQDTLFQRYLRQPGIEDGRFGLGLGMVLIRRAAAHHGGTVLIRQPESGGTQICLTLPIRQESSGTLRTPRIRVDYSGEQDHGLVELSDCLPLSAYYKD